MHRAQADFRRLRLAFAGRAYEKESCKRGQHIKTKRENVEKRLASRRSGDGGQVLILECRAGNKMKIGDLENALSLAQAIEVQSNHV